MSYHCKVYFSIFSALGTSYFLARRYRRRQLSLHHSSSSGWPCTKAALSRLAGQLCRSSEKILFVLL